MSNSVGIIRAMATLDTRDILARNIRRQIEHDTPEGDRPSVRGWALARGLDVKLVERLIKNHNAVTLGNLEKVAAAIGCEAWHLLLPDFEPGKTPAPPLNEADKLMLIKLRRLLGDSTSP